MTIKENYIAFCESHFVPLFFKPFWMQIQGHNWHVLMEQEGNHVVYFVCHLEKKLRFKIIRNSFLTPYSGFLCSEQIPAEVKARLSLKIFSKLPAFHEFQVDLHPDAGTELVFDSFNMSKKITNILDIRDINQVYDNYKPSLKRQIKKGTKTLHIEERDDIKSFFDLHEKTFSKQDKKAITPFAAFEKTWLACKKYKCGNLLFAIDEYQNVHAALFLVYDARNAYYLAGGTDADFYGSGAMSLLMHSAITRASESGIPFFDFEGSMLSGVNRFFKNFSPLELTYLTVSKMDSIILKWYKGLK